MVALGSCSPLTYLKHLGACRDSCLTDRTSVSVARLPDVDGARVDHRERVASEVSAELQQQGRRGVGAVPWMNSRTAQGRRERVPEGLHTAVELEVQTLEA